MVWHYKVVHCMRVQQNSPQLHYPGWQKHAMLQLLKDDCMFEVNHDCRILVSVLGNFNAYCTSTYIVKLLVGTI